MENFLTWVIFGVPVFIISGTVHEYMHAWSAKKLGDLTATLEGRLSLNPIVHIDPFGFLMMIIAHFGWMKPVPVNEYHFKNPVRDMALTAAAGPVSNLVMAIISAIIYRLLFGSELLMFLGEESTIFTFIENFVTTFIWVNAALMLFNLIPLPPLDGSRIIRLFLPPSLRYQWESLEKYSPIILLLLFILPPLNYITGTLLTTGVLLIVSLLT